MVLMNLCAGQEYTRSLREQTCAHSRERRRGNKLRAALTYTHFYALSSVAQSCPTLLNPVDCSTPGLPVHH